MADDLYVRWHRIVCWLRGHDVRAIQPWGGWPGEVFGITADCRRCGCDCSIVVPSQIVIERSDS